jgi:hypothetical protein
MMAAQRPDFMADELVLLSPANWGAAKKPDGADNPDFTRNKTEYLDYLRNITKPSVVVFFAKDIFDPGGRGPETEAILSDAHVPLLLIDQPKEVWGHGASWIPGFDYAYGDCIERFLLTPVDGRCQAKRIANDDFRAINSYRQLADADEKKLAGADFRALLGKTFVTFSNTGGAEESTFTSPTELRAESFKGVETRPITFADSGYCYAEGKDKVCRWLRRWSDDKLLAFDPKTTSTLGWWILKAGPAK